MRDELPFMAIAVVGLFVVITLAFVIIGGQPAPNTNESTSGVNVYYWHDDEHHVSCWLYGGYGNDGKAISCLPDEQVTR